MKSDIANSSPATRVNYTLLNNAIRTRITVAASDFGILQVTANKHKHRDGQLGATTSCLQLPVEERLSTRRWNKHMVTVKITCWENANELDASLLLENSSCAATVPSISLGLISLVQSPSASLV